MKKVNYDKYRELTGVAISTNMTGKMYGIDSLSTSVLCNPYCKARQAIKGSICEHCFAVATAERFTALSINLEKNTEVLTASVLDVIPDVDATNRKYFRFESFGDLNNEVQFVNYWNIAKHNPKTKFALWTKNPAIVERAYKQYGLKRLNNLTMILSSLYINKPDKDYTGLFDHVFTVYGKEYKNADFINCGARSCATCGRCYTRKTALHVAELLK